MLYYGKVWPWRAWLDQARPSGCKNPQFDSRWRQNRPVGQNQGHAKNIAAGGGGRGDERVVTLLILEFRNQISQVIYSNWHILCSREKYGVRRFSVVPAQDLLRVARL